MSLNEAGSFRNLVRTAGFLAALIGDGLRDLRARSCVRTKSRAKLRSNSREVGLEAREQASMIASMCILESKMLEALSKHGCRGRRHVREA